MHTHTQMTVYLAREQKYAKINGDEKWNGEKQKTVFPPYSTTKVRDFFHYLVVHHFHI